MKPKDCICGRGEECKGVSAAFYILDDPRSGYTQVPRYRPSTESLLDKESNRLREALLRNILPSQSLLEECNQVNKNLFIANHHFHPKLVEQHSRGTRCTLPVSIPQEEADEYKLDSDEQVLDQHGEPTGHVYVIPNYSFHKAKRHLKRAAKQRRPAHEKKRHHHRHQHKSMRNVKKDDLVGMIVTVDMPVYERDLLDEATKKEVKKAQRAQRIVDEFQIEVPNQNNNVYAIAQQEQMRRRSSKRKTSRRTARRRESSGHLMTRPNEEKEADSSGSRNDELPQELHDLVMSMDDEPFPVFGRDESGQITDDNLGMEAQDQARAARMEEEMMELKRFGEVPSSSKEVTEALGQLQEQLHQMEHEQQLYLSSRMTQKEELFQLIEGVGMKRDQVFDDSMPQLDAKMDRMGQQLEEAATYEASTPTMGENLLRLQEQLQDMEVEQQQYMSQRKLQKKELLDLMRGVETQQQVDSDDSVAERSTGTIESTSASNCDSEDDLFHHANGMHASLHQHIRHGMAPPNISVKTLASAKQPENSTYNAKPYPVFIKKGTGHYEKLDGQFGQQIEMEVPKKTHVGSADLKRGGSKEIMFAETPHGQRHDRPPVRSEASSGVAFPSRAVPYNQQRGKPIQSESASDLVSSTRDMSRSTVQSIPSADTALTSKAVGSNSKEVPGQSLFSKANVKILRKTRKSLSRSERRRSSTAKKIFDVTKDERYQRSKHRRRTWKNAPVTTVKIPPPGQDTGEDMKMSAHSVGSSEEGVVFEPSLVKVQSFARTCLASSDFHRKRRASIQIQSAARAAFVRKEQMIHQTSAITLQSFARRYIAMKQFNDLQATVCAVEQERMNSNAVLIQSAVRRYLTLCRYQTILRGIVLLQASTRGIAERNVATEISAALIIQSLVRAFLAVDALRREKQAVAIIQRNTRGMLERNRLERTQEYAIIIQTSVRRFLALLSYRTVINGIILLQAAVRGAFERSAATEISASLIIQSVARTVLAVSEYRRQRQSIVTIQSAARGMSERSRLEELQLCAIIIQSTVRRHLVMLQSSNVTRGLPLLHTKSEPTPRMIESLVIAQSVVRAFLASSAFRRQRDASIVIQSASRGMLERSELDRRLISAIAVQSIVRRYLARVKYQDAARGVTLLPAESYAIPDGDETSLLTASAIVAQSVVRSYLVASTFRRQKNASLVIQRASRSMLERKRVESRLREDAAVIQIQSVLRCYLAKRNFGVATHGISQMQAAARGIAGREVVARRKASLVVIQSVVRVYLASNSFRRKRDASIVIQSAARSMLETRKVERLQSESIAIQSAVRRYLALRRYRAAVGGIVLLQASARGAAERNVATEISASMIIQSVARSFLASTAFRQQKRSSIVIQSASRGLIERNKIERLHVCARVIQGMVRRNLAMRKYKEVFVAIPLLQAAARGASQRKATKHRVESLIVVQSFARSFLASSSFRRRRRASILVQSSVRGMIVRKELDMLCSCAVTVQAMVRGYLAMRNYHMANRGVSLLQATVRGVQQRKVTSHMIASVITLQSFIRVFLASCWFRTQKKGVSLLQATARGVQQRKVTSHMIASVITLQSFTRVFLASCWFRTQKKGVSLLQATVRGVQQRKVTSHMIASVITLQSFIRVVLASCWFRTQKNAAISIQSATRGLLVRNNRKLLPREHPEVTGGESHSRAIGRGESQSRIPSPLSTKADHELSRAEMYDHLLALESKRRSTSDRKIELSFVRWRSSVELLRAGIHETARAERLILGSAIVNQACADAMQAIYKDVLLDDEGNAVSDERSQTQLLEQRNQERSTALTDEAGSGNVSNDQHAGILTTLIGSHAVLAEQYAENADFVVNEVTEEVSRFRELLQEKVKDVRRLGDATIDDMKGAETRVLEAWKAYDAVAAEAVTPDANGVPAPEMRRSLKSTGSFRMSENRSAEKRGSLTFASGADLWLVEMRYRFAVANQSSIWETVSELFQIVIKTEFARRERLKELLLDFVPRQRRLFSISASTQARVLQELLDRDQSSHDVERDVQAVAQKLAVTRQGGGTRSKSPLLEFDDDEFSDYKVLLSESPLANRLVRSSMVIEMKMVKGCWQRALAVVTVDSFLHVFDMPSTVEAPPTTNEVFLTLPAGESTRGEGTEGADHDSIMGILRDFSPSESLFLPNCVVTSGVDDQRYIFVTESRQGRFGNTTARKLLLRTGSPAATAEWITTLNGKPSEKCEAAAELAEESDPSALGRMIQETNVPSTDVFSFAHGASETFTTEYDSGKEDEE